MLRQFKIMTMLFCVAFVSCKYDYSKYMDAYKPQVIVNSFISPDQNITAELLWSKNFNDFSDFKKVKNFDAKVYENDILVYEGVNLNDSIITSFKPKEGAKYRLEANISGYGEISAKTYIPYKPEIDINFIKQNKDGNRIYFHFGINRLSVKEKLRSIMIRPKTYHEDPSVIRKWGRVYTKSIFCDEFNIELETSYNEYVNDDKYYGYYLRIPYTNLNNISPFEFATLAYTGEATGTYGSDDYKTTKSTILEVNIISPSDEYDRYFKDVYMQNFSQLSDIGIFNTPHPISFNIENGLGIFAGYSATKMEQKIEHDEE